MAKAPSLQFYPGDVQRDTALCAVSLAAYGLWHRMLWVMFDGTPYGHLSVNGSVIPPVNLARLLRVSEQELETLTAELETAGVLSRTPEGVIYSRRMVRDAKRRETNALNGGKGGNPELTGKAIRLSKSVNRKDNPRVNPLTADADAEDTSERERAKYPDDFTAFFKAYPEKKAKAVALKAWEKLRASERVLCQPAIEAQLKAKHFRGKDGQDYFPHCATWLNGRRWEDEIADFKPVLNINGGMTKEQADEEMRQIRIKYGRDPENGWVGDEECSRALLIYMGRIKERKAG